jgi:hypothetical protein
MRRHLLALLIAFCTAGGDAWNVGRSLSTQYDIVGQGLRGTVSVLIDSSDGRSLERSTLGPLRDQI